MTMFAVGATSACVDDALTKPVIPSAGSGGAGGNAGASGAGVGGTGTGGTGGRAGNGGTTGGGSGGSGVAPPTPALPVGSPTLSCPAQVSGSLEATDATQTGRHSRIAPVSACGATKSFPSNSADPTNPHLFDVYRFSNTSTTATCFTFTLTDGAPATLPDAGIDGGTDAGADAAPPDETPPDAGVDSGGGVTAMAAAGGTIAPDRYMTAYRTFYPSNLALEYRGDVGDALASPQTMSITVPASGTIDVVIYAVAVAPAGVGPYTLTCTR